MKKFYYIIVFFLCFTNIIINSASIFDYISPVPNTKLINPKECIILKPNSEIDKSSLKKSGSITVTGSESGKCLFSIVESDDYNTIILKSGYPFVLGEKITVSFTNSIKNLNGTSIKPYSYSFYIRKNEVHQDNLTSLENEIPSEKLAGIRNNRQVFSNNDFPVITVTVNNNPAQGYLLLSNIVFDIGVQNTNTILILQNNASPVFSREMTDRIFDFNRQPNGIFTYFHQGPGKYYGMNENYAVTDSFYTGNGYLTDLHELRLLQNGHALLMSYDKQIIDMSDTVQGGDTAAEVTGLVIQEIDQNKNVVFQWRSWDHFKITDATHENLLLHDIDYVHGNALELDNDGNILVSSRHMDEITKINRTNGNIIWRLGGKNNQFTFINDPVKFSHQHGIRRLNNGNVIMFDNGNYHTPPFSRAVEYILDEVNHTAAIAWQYQNTPNYFGYAMGFAQRLTNGNTLISWGSTTPTLTEVKPDGTKALQMTFNTGIFTYRAFKYDFNLVGISSNQNNNANSFRLSQNYPNPFNPSTSVTFDIPKSTFVNLSVYDAVGRLVETLVNEEFATGSYSVNYNASKLTSGVYLYKISAGDYTETKKMVLIK